MPPEAGPRRRLAPVTAAVEAVELARSRLFPLRLERWLALGFVAFLDGCGRSGSSWSFQFPGAPGGGTTRGGDTTEVDGAPDFSVARDWIGENLLVVVLAAAAVVLALGLLLALGVLVLWIHSRGVFMYLDDVATGRCDVVRPWHEHRERAWSYFLWKLGVGIASLLAFFALLFPAGWLVYSLFTSGPSCGAFAALGALALLLVALMLAASLFSILLRDFAAPLQWRLGLPCGPALAAAWGLVKAYPGPFAGYLGLKILFTFLAGVLGLVAGCLTCCLGFLPVIRETLLQPLHYFERGWSLMLLRQAGYDLFPSQAPEDPEPPPSPATG